MNKARLIITALRTENLTQQEAADRYGVSQSWVSKLVTRFRDEGEAAFNLKSRRPHNSPNKLSENTTQLILTLRKELSGQGHDSGAHTIAWHLTTHHNTIIHPATIWRCLKQHGAITPQPQKRPRSSYIRFEASLPNETWQSDFTHFRLATGADTEIITWLDDHSRLALHVSAHHRITAKIVLHTFQETTAKYGQPASTLTDNGMVFTTKLAAGRKGFNSRNALEAHLAKHGIKQKNSTPGHPTTCGKVERFQQTMKNWLRHQKAPTTIEDLQLRINQFVKEYNNDRPHRSLGRHTPAQKYEALGKDKPNPNTLNNESRVRYDKVDSTGVVTFRFAGKMHHIGIGRPHKNTKVIMLIDGLEIRVVDQKTGELIRELTLDPARDYQRQE
ncbi:MAG: IS481 family transposase [Pontimonas sp.]|jgi:transposase InsO family protein